MFCKKSVFRNVAKLTGKHLCHISFFHRTPLVAASESRDETEPNQNEFLDVALTSYFKIIYWDVFPCAIQEEIFGKTQTKK